MENPAVKQKTPKPELRGLEGADSDYGVGRMCLLAKLLWLQVGSALTAPMV